MAGTGSFESLASATCGVAGVREIRGSERADGLRVALVVSRFNTDLTMQLSHDAVSVLTAAGADPADVDVIWVTGAFEIPSILQRLAEAGRYDALVGMGAVIQGETIHANSIAAAVAQAISEIARHQAVPVIDAVVVAPDRARAEQRCASGPDSRGAYAARAAIEMVHVFRQLRAGEAVS